MNQAESLFLTKLAIAALVLIIALAITAWRRRHNIAKAADTAVVETLAAGLRASRTLRGKAATLAKRVSDRADGQ